MRSGPVEPDSARDDPLVRGEGRQEEISFCLSSAHSQCNTLEKVVDTEGQHYEESSGSGLNGLLHRHLDLVMTVAVAGAEVAGTDQHQVGELLQGVDEEESTQHQYLGNWHSCHRTKRLMEK